MTGNKIKIKQFSASGGVTKLCSRNVMANLHCRQQQLQLLTDQLYMPGVIKISIFLTFQHNCWAKIVQCYFFLSLIKPFPSYFQPHSYQLQISLHVKKLLLKLLQSVQNDWVFGLCLSSSVLETISLLVSRIPDDGGLLVSRILDDGQRPITK
jgi:hypothetical protein